MRVAELPGVGQPLRMATRPIPEPGPGEVRVRVQACGVCGSDLFLQKGGFGRPLPIVPGHEASGVVDAVGPGVDGWRPGEQAALYYITTPPDDPWAARGVPNRSPDVVRMGVDVDGAFAEYVLRPADALIRAPAPVDPGVLAVLTDAVATPLHALKRVARVMPGETVVVLGVATASVSTASTPGSTGAGARIRASAGRSTYSANAPSTSTPMRTTSGLRLGTPCAAQRSPGGVVM